jgi:ankyrin repeat protein
MKARRLSKEIIKALYRKDYAALKRLLNKDTINATDEEGGLTLLMLAVSAAEDTDPVIVKLLIERGADVNCVESSERTTALHLAARDLRKDIIELLLAAEADVNAQDFRGFTPLHYIVMAPDPRRPLVDLLLNHGADPHLKENNGRSPKEFADEIGEHSLFKQRLPARGPVKGKGKKGSAQKTN